MGKLSKLVGKRRKAREIVLLVLYEREFSDLPWEAILDEHIETRLSSPETGDHARALLAQTIEHVDELDKMIRGALSNWDLERLSLIDKNIMRFALAEILFFRDVPSKVIINEAIEVAHKYSSQDAGKLVNGVLDHFVQVYRRDLA